MQRPWVWSSLPRDRALGAEILYRMERRLSGDLSNSLNRADEAFGGAWTSVGDSMIPNLSFSSGWAIQFAGRHRAWRVAARILLAARGGKPPPSTEETLIARWPGVLDTDPAGVRLCYIALDGKEFRIEADFSGVPDDLMSARDRSHRRARELPESWVYRFVDSLQVRIPSWFVPE